MKLLREATAAARAAVRRQWRRELALSRLQKLMVPPEEEEGGPLPQPEGEGEEEGGEEGGEAGAPATWEGDGPRLVGDVYGGFEEQARVRGAALGGRYGEIRGDTGRYGRR